MLLALALVAGCGERTPRGLVLVTIDTCRADRIGVYGSGLCGTPAIDGIAEQGTVFLQASAPVPLTLPSHCTILTGLYPDRHTLRDNGAGRLPADARTIAEVLSERGWKTAAFVSAVPVGSEFGTDQGFATYDDAFTASSAGATKDESEQAVAEKLFFEERVAGETADSALAWLASAREGSDPFFAWIHFFDPHAVYRPPPPHSSRYGPGSYEGEVAYVDEQIGRIVAAVGGAEAGVTVAVTADHGESLGDHGEQTHGLFVYESTLHVPWVLAGPRVPVGARVADPVSLVDVMPTLLEAVGVPEPEGIDGRSRLAAARGEERASDDVLGECLLARLNYGWAGLRSIRRGQWKLIDAPRPELFDLSTDPRESRNVAAANPEMVRDLVAALDGHHSRGTALPAEEASIDPLVREQLERLGYIGGGSEEEAAGADLWNRSGRDPKDMVEFFNRFQEVPTLMIDGRHAEAEQILVALRAEDPSNVKVLERLALLKRLDERWAEVAELCEEIVRRNPADGTMRKNLAFAKHRLGDRAAALRGYRDAVAATPDDADAWALLGSLLSEDGAHQEAVEALSRAAELAPQDAAARAELARAREASGDTAGALADYDRALALDPGSEEAVNGKALLLSHSGHPREAVDVLRAGLRQAPDDIEALNNLAWILADESIDPSEAFTVAARVAQLAPDDPAVLDTHGWASIRAGRPADGLESLHKAYELTRDAEVRAHLGIALAETGRTADGRAHVRAAVSERPELAEIPEVAKWR
jgi:arylsulfatase A-like enzyme/Flp pilus assembly protein TadD